MKNILVSLTLFLAVFSQVQAADTTEDRTEMFERAEKEGVRKILLPAIDSSYSYIETKINNFFSLISISGKTMKYTAEFSFLMLFYHNATAQTCAQRDKYKVFHALGSSKYHLTRARSSTHSSNAPGA